MPEEKLGVESVKNAMDYIYRIGKVTTKVMSPESPGGKKIVLQEYPEYIPVVVATPALIKSIPNIPPELKDLSMEEVDELVEHAQTTYDLPSDKAKILVVNSIQVAGTLWVTSKKLFLKDED